MKFSGSALLLRKSRLRRPHLSLRCNVQAPTEVGIACNSFGYEYVAEIYFCGIRISFDFKHIIIIQCRNENHVERKQNRRNYIKFSACRHFCFFHSGTPSAFRRIAGVYSCFFGIVTIALNRSPSITISSVPPCSSTMLFAIESPNPEPSVLLDTSPRLNLSSSSEPSKSSG